MRYNNESQLKEAQAYIDEFLTNWQKEGKNQKQLAQALKDFTAKSNGRVKFSESTLSRIKNKDSIISEQKYFQLYKLLQQFVLDEESPTNFANSRSNPYSTLEGLYEVYHQTKYGGNLLKNVLEINTEQQAILYSDSGHIHKARVEIFEQTMVALNFYAIDEKPFFYQIIFNLKGYLAYGLTPVTHIWGISTTISLEQIPMANIRILCPTTPNSKPLPENIPLESTLFEEHLAEKPFLNFFKNAPDSRLLCPYNVNDFFVN